jgi:hypothetical protein
MTGSKRLWALPGMRDGRFRQHNRMNSRVTDRLGGLSRGGDGHMGRLAVTASQAALWLTFMSITWLVPNDNPVWVRVGFTLALTGLCGSFAGKAYADDREALREQRLEKGLCPRCGYDLRATPGRCPECGRTAPPPARRQTSQG